MQYVVTHDLIEKGMSANGGWNRKQLSILGVKWPPKHGWKQRVIGTTISKDDAELFVALSGCVNIRKGQQATVVTVGGLNKDSQSVQMELEDGRKQWMNISLKQLGADLDTKSRSYNLMSYDYTYCVTAHKAQGSDFAKVVAIEQIGSSWNPARWRYTVTTRARDRVVYCR